MISREQAAEILTTVAHYDNRPFTNKTIDTWWEAGRRARWHVADALEAVHAHFREHSRQIYPLDITERIRAARDIPRLPGQPGRKPTLSPHADPDCTMCDEYGWVLDSEDRYGWVIRCRHDPNQVFTPRPDDHHEAAQLIRAGRALEDEGHYRRVHAAPDLSEPRSAR
ncbi:MULTISPECIES: hypothetical protein [Nocardia]|uniref:hypothetical protein n=1 Tax=Nocardia TaxID=1817 RepID=UPI002455B602|nr:MULTISPECIES: hypothetical protein [Nocardia]